MNLTEILAGASPFESLVIAGDFSARDVETALERCTAVRNYCLTLNPSLHRKSGPIDASVIKGSFDLEIGAVIVPNAEALRVDAADALKRAPARKIWLVAICDARYAVAVGKALGARVVVQTSSPEREERI